MKILANIVSIRSYSAFFPLARRRWLRRCVLKMTLLRYDLDARAVVLRAHQQINDDIERRQGRTRAVSMATFNIDAFSTVEALLLFLFKVVGMGQLAQKVAVDVKTRRRHSTSPGGCWAIVLRCLSSLCRWVDLEIMFGRSASSLSELLHATIELLVERCGGMVTAWRHNLIAGRGQQYVAANAERGAPICNSAGSVDGTTCFFARPGGGYQRSCYNGQKRTRGLKSRSLTLPDGLLFHVYGPFEGRRHDFTLYRLANMDAELQRTFPSKGRDSCAYADSAYMLRPWLQNAFGGDATLEQREYNTAMSALRVFVEWGFKDITTIFGHLDFRRKQNVREGPVGKLFLSCCFLWNFLCCIYVSPTPTFFSRLAPRLDECLADEYMHRKHMWKFPRIMPHKPRHAITASR